MEINEQRIQKRIRREADRTDDTFFILSCEVNPETNGSTLVVNSLCQLPQKSVVNFSCVLAVVMNRRNRKLRAT